MNSSRESLARRLERLERRLGGIPEPETDAMRARRLVLCRAAWAGREPEDLAESERAKFSRIVASIPIARELQDGGLVGDDGEPSGADDHRDLQYGDDFGGAAWIP